MLDSGAALLIFVLGAACAILMATFLLLAAVFALSRLMPNWTAALVVGLCMGMAASITFTIGVRKMKQSKPLPVTVATLKENLEWQKPLVK